MASDARRTEKRLIANCSILRRFPRASPSGIDAGDVQHFENDENEKRDSRRETKEKTPGSQRTRSFVETSDRGSGSFIPLLLAEAQKARRFLRSRRFSIRLRSIQEVVPLTADHCRFLARPTLISPPPKSPPLPEARRARRSRAPSSPRSSSPQRLPAAEDSLPSRFPRRRAGTSPPRSAHRH